MDYPEIEESGDPGIYTGPKMKNILKNCETLVSINWDSKKITLVQFNIILEYLNTQYPD